MGRAPADDPWWTRRLENWCQLMPLAEFQAALDEAEHFFTTRDPSEVGCLYYSPSLSKFVEPRPGDEVVPHYGRPGGVLPTVG